MRNKLIILSLFIACLTALPSFAMNGRGMGTKMGTRMGMKERMEERFARCLESLPAETQTQIREKHLEMMQNMIKLRADLHTAMLNMERLQLQEAPSRQALVQTVDKIGDIRKKIDMAHLDFEAEIRNILTPEQYQEWRLCRPGNRWRMGYYQKMMPRMMDSPWSDDEETQESE